eukprot:10262631-Heterocapsa_arctica.AAC.1
MSIPEVHRAWRQAEQEADWKKDASGTRSLSTIAAVAPAKGKGNGSQPSKQPGQALEPGSARRNYREKRDDSGSNARGGVRSELGP